MQSFKVRILHVVALVSTCFCSCQKWDPDKQFENDIITQSQNALLLEARANEARQLELNNYIQDLSALLGTSEFLDWAKNKTVPFNIVTKVKMDGQDWENREYDFKNLIVAEYGLQSEMHIYYNKVNYPLKLTMITNGKRIINPIIY
tara:strand:+ start:164 stop:604 length:441 start_codon:yes stop_codon:yes gene_type:complete